MNYNVLITAIIVISGFSNPVMGVYYSQIGQDKYVNEHFFHNKKNGVFIDIGAHDGITYSNTYFFEKELGWKGICFEPIKTLFEELITNRSCICINKCVGLTQGVVQFIEAKGYSQALSGMVATYHPLHLKRLQREIAAYGGSFDIITVDACAFNKTLTEHSIFEVDFLSIDTEGGELEILQSIDFATITISVIAVENNYGTPTIRSFLESKNFEYVTTIACQDEIYVNKCMSISS